MQLCVGDAQKLRKTGYWISFQFRKNERRKWFSFLCENDVFMSVQVLELTSEFNTVG